jgi:hypothetical protein
MLLMNLAILVGSMALITVVTLATFRFIARAFGVRELVEEGVVLAENGIEFPGMLLLNKGKIAYSNIEFVKLESFVKNFFKTIFLCYGISVRFIRSRFSKDVVVIKVKRPVTFCEYFFFTPKNATVFVEQLKERVEKADQIAAVATE